MPGLGPHTDLPVSPPSFAVGRPAGPQGWRAPETPVEGSSASTTPAPRRVLQRLHDAGAALTASGGGPVAAPAHPHRSPATPCPSAPRQRIGQVAAPALPHRSSPRHVRAPLASASVKSAQIEKACTHHQRVSTPAGTSRHRCRGPARLRAAARVSTSPPPPRRGALRCAALGRRRAEASRPP